MKISVLISVYKSEKGAYLDEAINSIWQEQTLKPNEIILVEDGPLTTELYDVINKWKESLSDSLVIIKNDTNIGLTKSLNKGINIAKYNVIARMDSDDKSHPERFAKQIEYLKKHPEISIVGGAIQEFNSENEHLGVRRYPLTPEAVREYIYKASPLAHPAVMIRRQIFDDGHRYNEQYRTSQDLALWFDVIKSGYQIANIEDIVLYFRQDGDIFKRRSKAKANNEFKIYMNGIRRVYGLITWRYVFPIARYLFRLTPVPILKLIYRSKLRNKVLNS